MIKHLWLDFSDTLAVINRDKHNKLRHKTYAEIVGKEVTPELVGEFEELAQKHKNNNTAMFVSLGKAVHFWSDKINSVDTSQLYSLADANIPRILNEIKKILPVSIFSNINIEKLLPSLGLDQKLFTNILDAKMVKASKPALDGFYKIIELSKVPASEILYIGDDLHKDILPAKKVGLKTGLMWKESSEADYCFKNFEEILSFFEQSN